MFRGRCFSRLFVLTWFPLLAQVPPLLRDQAVDGRLGAGQTNQFFIQIERNDFVRLVVGGQGGLFSLRLDDPQGKLILEQTRSGGVRDPILWALVLDAPGPYRLEVISRETGGGARPFHLALLEQRAADDRDRLRAAASSALLRGEELEQQGHGDPVPLFEQARQLSERAGDASLEGEALFHLGQAQFSAGHPAEAESAFERAIEQWRSAGDRDDEARAQRGLGKAYGDTQQSVKASEVLNRALAISGSSADAAGQAEALCELGSVAGARSDYAKAGTLFTRALSLARQAADRRTEADALNMLGVLDQNTGQDAEALANYEAALALRRAISDRAGVAQSATNLGVFHRNLGEARAAVGYYEEGLAIRRQIGNAQGLAVTLENLAVAQADLGNFEQSLALSREAADLFHSSRGQRGETFALINLGDDYSRMGEAEQALEHYTRAREIAQTTGDRRAQAIVLLSIGSVYAARQQLDPARAADSEALAISRATGDQRELAQALFALAETALARGDVSAAIVQGRGALDAIRALDDRRGEARALSFLGGVLLDSNRAEAVGMLRQALEIQKDIVDPDQEAVTYSRLARAARQAGDWAAARERSLTALDLLESVRRNAPPEGPRISFQAAKQPFYQQAIDILMALERQDPKGGFAAQALEVSERARARALLDQLAQSRVVLGAKVDPALAAEASHTLELVDAKAARLTRLLGSRHTPEQARQARGQLDELESHYQEIRAEIRRGCPQCSEWTDPQPLSLARIQRQILDDHSILLEYALGQDRGYLWAVTKTSLRTYELPARSELEKLVRELRAAIVEPARATGQETADARRLRIAGSQRDFERTAAVLAHVLVPASPELTGKRILIAADGILNSVPFAALLPRGAEPVVLPSISVLGFLRDRQKGAPSRFAITVFADPVYPAGSTEFPRLRLSREEALRITALTPGKKTVVLGADATRASVEDPNLARSSIVHFAAHAWIDEQRPELSGIALSDGVLRLNDIYQLSLHARLVVLSACRTALGKAADGEGPISLARAFLYAGASGVVASLWDVDDRATEVFMTHFYDGLFRRNLPAAGALDFARDFMRSNPAWRHPYYWAGFVLVGDSPRFVSASTRHG
ncbi:MAG TPA: CHAT domain-containing protein [Bryobacteraceae bacterium]|nr:CHAT domain-containing protein [Bryobacteraceae bacterium]